MVINFGLTTNPAYKTPMFGAAVTTKPLLTGNGTHVVEIIIEGYAWAVYRSTCHDAVFMLTTSVDR